MEFLLILGAILSMPLFLITPITPFMAPFTTIFGSKLFSLNISTILIVMAIVVIYSLVTLLTLKKKNMI